MTSERPILITGGAGFVGSNLADHLLRAGRAVRVYDNLSRPGVERNLAWLRANHGERMQFIRGDVRDRDGVRAAVAGTAQVYHFAAQVAVTTSLMDPLADFDVNARGTLHVLEAIRACPEPPSLVFTSTNKVYGALQELTLRKTLAAYIPVENHIRRHGINELRPLDFHSPYGCSKGAADQYVLDYARTYGLRAVVLRMSCIYGPRQFGTEDQGWVAHFLLQARREAAITVYGDGAQVRDVLYVDDLVSALCLAQERCEHLSGHAYNIGGGPENAVSLLDLVYMIREVHGKRPRICHEGWRQGDQRYYVSDTRYFAGATGWSPQVRLRQGLEQLYAWLCTMDQDQIDQDQAVAGETGVDRSKVNQDQVHQEREGARRNGTEHEVRVHA